MSEIKDLGNIDNFFQEQDSKEEKKAKNVILRAPVLTQSGYGCHSRQIARWLLEQVNSRNDIELFVEPLQWGNTPWFLDSNSCDGLVGKMFQHSAKAEHYDVSLQVQLPNEWNPFLADCNIGVTAGVEGDRCNPEWVSCVNNMDLVIVPSEFTKQSFINTGEVETEIVVVPESFTDACKPGALDVSNGGTLDEIVDLSSITTDFNFLVFGQFCGSNPENDRKNLAYTIKWVCEEFKDNPDVGVVLKTNTGRATKADKTNTISAVTRILTEVKQGQGPRFYLLHGHMSDEEVAALYRHEKITALLSLTHAEGFCLPALEAASCELPVIITNWSAHTEYLRKGKYIKLDYQLAPIHESRVDNQIFVEGMKWAYPNESDVKRKLRRFYRSPDIPKDWAKNLSKILQKEYSFESIAEKYSKTLKDII